MNIDFSAQELAFQKEVSAFLATELPSDIRDKAANNIELTKDDFVTWQKILARKGWAATNWPVEFGGTGWTPTQKYIFDNECAKVGAPEVMAFGLKMVAPIIYTYGNDEQKQRKNPNQCKQGKPRHRLRWGRGCGGWRGGRNTCQLQGYPLRSRFFPIAFAIGAVPRRKGHGVGLVKGKRNIFRFR